MTKDQLYDYATPIEAALASIFEEQEFVIWTPMRDPAFQKERPRVEAILLPGSSLGKLRPEPGVRVSSGFLMEKARRSNLVVMVITGAAMGIHRQFLARTLFLMDTAGFKMNATGLMPYHSIQMVKCNGGTFSHDPTTGAYTSTMNFDVDFSVKEAAWNDLEP